jgi:hypothetical protein
VWGDRSIGTPTQTRDEGLSGEQWAKRAEESEIGRKLEALCAPEREAARLDKYRILLFMHALGVQLSRTVRARGRQVNEADLSRR